MNPTQRLHLHLRAKINGHISDQPYDTISLIVALARPPSVIAAEQYIFYVWLQTWYVETEKLISDKFYILWHCLVHL